VSPNPHYQRLARHYAPPSIGESYELGLKSLFLLGVLAHCFWLQGLSSGLYSLSFYDAFGQAITALLGTMLGIYATVLVSHDLSQIDFDLILLTPLTPSQIIGGYFHILVRHLQRLIYSALGFFWFQDVMVEFIYQFASIEKTLWLGTWTWVEQVGFGVSAICLGIGIALRGRTTPYTLVLSILLNSIWAGLWLVVGNSPLLLVVPPLILAFTYRAIRL
jgi:hypothetical protein